MINNHIFRASHTVLDQWQSGNYDRAIKTYFKLEQFVTPAMAEGKRYHEEWQNHIIKTKTLPAEFGGTNLLDPRPEGKIQVHITDWLDLVGVIDCYDNPIIYEWKTGKQSSEKYASSKQAGIYGVLATMANMYVEKAIIYRYDQYAKKSDMSIVWITDQLLKDSLNWIETISSEMHHYFIENKLYEKFGPNLNGNATRKFNN